jgi:hypothetical protein
MPFDTIKIHNDRTGEDMTLTEMEAYIEKMMKKQMTDLLQSADDKTFTYKDETIQTKYLAIKKMTEDYIVETLATGMSVDLLNEMIEKGFTDIDSSRLDSIKDARAKGGWYGEFVESSFFGLEKNTNPMADIMAIETEIKTHSGKSGAGSSPLGVGSVAVHGITAVEKSSDAVKNLVTLYKMAIKMQNFLLLQIEPVTSGGLVHMGFEEISLHLFLILKKLYDMIYSKIRSEKAVWAESAGWNPNTMTKIFSVRMSLSKINEVYTFVQLYLEHYDLLNKIKSSPADRANFWKNIKEIKLASISSGGRTPQFNLTLV